MVDSPKEEVKSLKQSLEYVVKLLTTAIIVVLLIVGAFLIYYVITAKIISKQAGAVPKLSLYTIVSGSMEPAIKVYDIILNVRVDDFSSLKVGDVITFNSYNSLIKDMTVTHRIIDIKTKENNTREFVTKGDFNQTADSAPIQEKDILGKTILKVPQLGRIQFLLASKMGWLFIVFIPALGIIIYDILKLFKVLGVTGKAESIEGNISNVVIKEENKKIMETLEKIRKNPQLFTHKAKNNNEEINNRNTEIKEEQHSSENEPEIKTNVEFQASNENSNFDTDNKI